jgi:hypothetical protein
MRSLSLLLVVLAAVVVVGFVFLRVVSVLF